MLGTRAYLPTGFKQTDFLHLSEGSFCFCVHCRVRLYPRRTAAEKVALKQMLNQGAPLPDAALIEEMAFSDTNVAGDESSSLIDIEPAIGSDIHIEELEIEAIDVQDIKSEGVDLPDEEDNNALTEDENL